MKHSAQEVAHDLHARAAEAGVDLGAEQEELLVRGLLAFLDANERVNLTSIREPLEAVRLHVVDSLTAIKELREAPQGEFLDLGTGGGFPGVPLAIVSDRAATLLDSTAKKAREVEAIVNEIGLSCKVEVVAARAEEIAVARQGRYAAVVARAVSALPSLVELAAPLLVPKGHLIALKGVPDQAEYHAGAAAGKLVGLRELHRRSLSLPGGGERRTIVVYERVSDPLITLPRRVGLAQREPLG